MLNNSDPKKPVEYMEHDPTRIQIRKTQEFGSLAIAFCLLFDIGLGPILLVGCLRFVFGFDVLWGFCCSRSLSS